MADRPLLADEVYRYLRDRIVTCTIAPGDRLSERQIARETGYGAMPIREAMARLDHDGLVETRPRSGHFVTLLDEQEVVDFFAIWRVIGPLIVELASRRRDAGLAAALERHDAQPEPASQVDAVAAARTRMDLLAEATANTRLIAIYRQLANELDRIYAMFLAESEGLDWLKRSNARGRIALSNADPDTAGDRMRAAIDTSRDRILAIVRRRAACHAS